MPSSSSEASGRAAAFDSTRARLGEILSVFVVASAVVVAGIRFTGDDPIAGQAVIWAAYAAMIAVIWAGLRLRGEGWSHLGLAFGRPSWRSVGKAVLLSIAVLIAALAAFVLGSIVAAPLFGLPAQADFSRYNPLRGNLPLLLVVLPGVWLVSSLGEEIVFRGFLITRGAELGGGGKIAWRGAVLLSAIVFGLAHYAWGPTGVVQTTLLGLAMGAAFLLVRRNLWVTVLTHVYLDTLLLVPMYLA